jgi:hypothetical protein
MKQYIISICQARVVCLPREKLGQTSIDVFRERSQGNVGLLWCF